MLGDEVLHKADLHHPRAGLRQTSQIQVNFLSGLPSEKNFASVFSPRNYSLLEEDQLFFPGFSGDPGHPQRPLQATH